nr:hypothetical protein HmN_000914600 [Hymenolepis microstoma]
MRFAECYQYLPTSRERREAKDLLLECKRAQLPDDKDLDDLWNALEKNMEASVDGMKWFITSHSCSARLSKKFASKSPLSPLIPPLSPPPTLHYYFSSSSSSSSSHFFSAPTFAKLSHGEHFSRVNIQENSVPSANSHFTFQLQM